MKEKEIKLPEITMQCYQQDWIPGFAAFIYYADRKGFRRKNKVKADIAINIGSFMALVASDNVDAKELPYILAETMMHEFIHVLEAYFQVEFSEEKVHKIIGKYRMSQNEPNKKI